MNQELEQLSFRIYSLAYELLAQANTNLTFSEMGIISNKVGFLNGVMAGELFLKGFLAEFHPLIIFKQLPELNEMSADRDSVRDLLYRGQTYTLSSLPPLIYSVTGKTIPKLQTLRKAARNRNLMTHFLAPDDIDVIKLALTFLYECVEPLVGEKTQTKFVESIEMDDFSYLVGNLIRNEIEFSFPNKFDVTEIELKEELVAASENYQRYFITKLVNEKHFELITEHNLLGLVKEYKNLDKHGNKHP